MAELWADIKNYEGFYQVSNFGRVKGVDRSVFCDTKVGYRPFTQIYKGIFLGTRPRTGGYLYVTLSKDNKQRTLRLHRLVANAFIPNPLNKEQVNHINGCKTDNRAENLEWNTGSENSLHSCRVLGNQTGEYNNKSKLVLNNATGVYYVTLTEAVQALGYPKEKYKQVSSFLTGKRKGCVPLIYV